MICGETKIDTNQPGAYNNGKNFILAETKKTDNGSQELPEAETIFSRVCNETTKVLNSHRRGRDACVVFCFFL